MKIFVSGATGHLGGKIIEFLAKKLPAGDIIAGTTNPGSEKALRLTAQGIEVRKADFEDQASLVEAFTGIDKVFIVSTFGDLELYVRQQTNAVEAAKQAGVQQLVYSSAPRADVSPFILAGPHLVRENIIKESGIPYVFVRNNWYVENELATIQQCLNGAPWVTSAGEGKVGWVLRADLAEATANVLATGGHDNKIYELGGDNLTQAEFVTALNDVTGKEIAVMNVDDATYSRMLEQANLPAEMIGMLTMIQQGIREGGLDINPSDLEMLLGRKPAGVKEALQLLLA
ncbi:SDR family oxidoreductase [Paenibacillus sp. FSL R7-0331]|uniref:SDR family oxidoreductase n=1 Tax=Paenibacillus sp. FSL R7-0331 TaxID=1536773 RepID=UPI0004F809B3|nr:SDR family oxidoreductase [Paenibacillus sp. FSL R7-0331]AIQ52925.1 NmrA family protein [Paenibacillus sp. FSL R7-0331]